MNWIVIFFAGVIVISFHDTQLQQAKSKGNSNEK